MYGLPGSDGRGRLLIHPQQTGLDFAPESLEVIVGPQDLFHVILEHLAAVGGAAGRGAAEELEPALRLLLLR